MASEITDIAGVYGSGMNCGIKPGKNDLAFLFVPDAVACAAVVTRNIFCAPCIVHTKNCAARGVIKALVVNSGNANAATGDQGARNVRTTAEAAAKFLGLKPEEVAVASTGIIGVPLPIEKLQSGLEQLLESPRVKNGDAVSAAILTTDLCSKKVFLQKEIGGKLISIAGIAKGSGMIAPNMATMLGYLALDLALPQETLQSIFVEAVDASFNMVSVDTDTSTSDMALLFSTGAIKLELTEQHLDAVSELIRQACVELAKMIARDGEGATKLIEVTVAGAQNLSDARVAAKSIIDSPLVKTAIHGADPNWGRVMMAIGKHPSVVVETERVKVYFGEHLIFANSKATDFEEQVLVEELKQPTVRIKVELGVGQAEATAWGCDLTKGYIDINTDYN